MFLHPTPLYSIYIYLVSEARIWQPSGLRCARRKAVAKELLDTPTNELEFNARQLKNLCGDELIFIARESRLPLKHTSNGSMVFAIVSSINAALHGDTQMVESINSIIKLISTRCPRIDLETLSARIVTKKCGSSAFANDNIFGSHDEDRTIKKWSRLKHVLRPVLEECLHVGDQGYIAILNQKNRFQPPQPILGHESIHQRLINTDLAVALPNLKVGAKLDWIAKCLRDVNKACVANTDKLDPLQRACMLTGFRTGPLFRPELFAIQTGTYRSENFLLKATFGPHGEITLPHGQLEFQTLSSFMNHCSEDSMNHKIDLVVAPLLFMDGYFAPITDVSNSKGVGVGCLTTGLPKTCPPNAFKPLVILDDENSHTRKMKMIDSNKKNTGDSEMPLLRELDDLQAIQAGYGFGGDVEQSQQLAAELEAELGQDDTVIAKRSVQAIKATGILRSTGEALFTAKIQPCSILFGFECETAI